MKTLKRIIFITLVFCIPGHSFGWGPLGHRIVGQIADSYLTRKARNAIKEILGDESIAMSSNWADFIKSDSSYNYLSSWHYIDFDAGLTREQVLSYLATDTATDIYTKMNFLIDQLKNKQLSPDKKKMDLKLLIHFVGDVHQPFHVGHRDDLGGNKIRVTWFNTPTNLHAVWDDQLINFQQLSYTEYTNAINHTTEQERLAWQQQPISEWVAESYLISERLYTEVKPDDKLGYRYNYTHIALLNQQLVKAGVRLAGLLNQIFG